MKFYDWRYGAMVLSIEQLPNPADGWTAEVLILGDHGLCDCCYLIGAACGLTIYEALAMATTGDPVY
jgi:hypothetical protein